MSPDSIFQICSSIAMAGWIVLLIISPFWSGFDKFLIGIIFTLFIIIYAWLIFKLFGPGDFESFVSLIGVLELFTDKIVVTAGWLHYLAFDLLTVIWLK